MQCAGGGMSLVRWMTSLGSPTGSAPNSRTRYNATYHIVQAFSTPHHIASASQLSPCCALRPLSFKTAQARTLRVVMVPKPASRGRLHKSHQLGGSTGERHRWHRPSKRDLNVSRHQARFACGLLLHDPFNILTNSPRVLGHGFGLLS